MARGKAVTTSVFAAGQARFAIACRDASMRSLAETVFVDLITDLSDAEHILELTEKADGTYELLVPEAGDFPAQTARDAIGVLVTAITRLSLDHEPDFLHLHAAAVSSADAGLVVVGPSGFGKSTLTAALVERGWSYTSDESVRLDSELPRCHGFPKPITLKASTPLIKQSESLRDALASLGFADTDDENPWPVPASLLTDTLSSTLTPAVVASLEMTSSFDAAAVVADVHPVDMVVALMGQTLDAHRYGGRTLEVLARLAASARCVQLRPGPVEQMVTLLSHLVHDPGGQFRMTTLDPARGPESEWTVKPSVRSARIDDRVVVHELEEGNIVALDDAGSAVWLALHGQSPSWFAPEALESEASRSFLTQLASLSFLNDPARTRQGTER